MCTLACGHCCFGNGDSDSCLQCTVEFMQCRIGSWHRPVVCSASVLRSTISFALHHGWWLGGVRCMHWEIHPFTYLLPLLVLLVRNCLPLPIACGRDVLLLKTHKFPRRLSHDHPRYVYFLGGAFVVLLVSVFGVYPTVFCVPVSQCQ